ncbi:hypothetical protein DFH07DRAFT_810558 [Mycena maculata]|uniref:DUF7330 domain-containing protein n=1 Tax=Mycena maculata TaxID=230809 RepID=A0AAD7NLS9_9AGAR|nr:hypothetical protein DFH07DRAFT_810558 [Mycena maculata]
MEQVAQPRHSSGFTLEVMLIDQHKSQLAAAESSALPIEERPPPYSLASGSSSISQQTSRLSVLPPLPTEAQSFQTSPSSNLGPRPSPTTPGPSYSQIRLESRSSDITGTFYIEPKPPLSQYTNKKKKRDKPVPDAVFRTRSAKIALELATVGYARDVPKAIVRVASKSGRTTLNLLPADESRPRFDLEVKSNSGTVVLFVPQTYAGAIQLHTKHGSLEFLEAISSRMKVVKSSETESLVLFGKQTEPSSQLPSDFCHVKTRSGKVVVGLRGEDIYVEGPGLWERIGGFLKGDFKGNHASP